MFRHLTTAQLNELQLRAATSAGSNLEVMLGLVLQFIRFDLERELALRAESDPTCKVDKPQRLGTAGAPIGDVVGAGTEQGSGGAAS